MTSVTFVIPTRDRHDYVHRAIHSATSLGHPVVVVDDGSRSPVTVRRPLARVIRHDRSRGVAAARNTGFGHVETEYVAFLDDDDVTLPRPEPTGDVTVYGFARTICADTILDGFTPHVGQVAVRRAVCPPMDPKYRGAEDLEWWLRLATVGLDLRQVDDPGFTYTRHDGPRASGGVTDRIQGSRRLLEEHADYFDAHPTAKAFRLARIAAMQRKTGHPLLATVSAARAMRVQPSKRPLVALVKGV